MTQTDSPGETGKQPGERSGERGGLRYRLEWGLLNFALWLLRLMPPDTASTVMGKAWRLFARFNSRHRRALGNLAKAMPELSQEEHQRILLGMWENLGRIAAETLQLDRLVSDPERFEYDVDDVREAVGDGGAVVVSLHAGNWEVTAMGGLAAGWQPVGVYQTIKNPLVDKLVHDLRARIYPGGLYPKSHETARRLLTIARSGGRTAMLADLQDRRGAVIPFFGRDAWATVYPATIARAAGVPLVASRVIRLPANRFRIEARIVEMPRTGDRKADALEATQRYHALFERWIRENPSQWMWIMRKWL